MKLVCAAVFCALCVGSTDFATIRSESLTPDICGTMDSTSINALREETVKNLSPDCLVQIPSSVFKDVKQDYLPYLVKSVNAQNVLKAEFCSRILDSGKLSVEVWKQMTLDCFLALSPDSLATLGEEHVSNIPTHLVEHIHYGIASRWPASVLGALTEDHKNAIKTDLSVFDGLPEDAKLHAISIFVSNSICSAFKTVASSLVTEGCRKLLEKKKEIEEDDGSETESSNEESDSESSSEEPVKSKDEE